MLMPARTVGMAVVELFFGRLADFPDGDVEVEGLTGERMIRVDRHIFLLDLLDGDDLGTLRCGGAELHAGFDFLNTLKLGHGNDTDQGFIAFAITFLGLHGCLNVVTRRFTFELFLEAGNDLAGAMHVSERFATFRTVDQFAVVVGEFVIEEDDFAFGDIHRDMVCGLVGFEFGWVICANLAARLKEVGRKGTTAHCRRPIEVPGIIPFVLGAFSDCKKRVGNGKDGFWRAQLSSLGHQLGEHDRLLEDYPVLAIANLKHEPRLVAGDEDQPKEMGAKRRYGPLFCEEYRANSIGKPV